MCAISIWDENGVNCVNLRWFCEKRRKISALRKTRIAFWILEMNRKRKKRKWTTLYSQFLPPKSQLFQQGSFFAALQHESPALCFFSPVLQPFSQAEERMRMQNERSWDQRRLTSYLSFSSVATSAFNLIRSWRSDIRSEREVRRMNSHTHRKKSYFRKTLWVCLVCEMTSNKMERLIAFSREENEEDFVLQAQDKCPFYFVLYAGQKHSHRLAEVQLHKLD